MDLKCEMLERTLQFNIMLSLFQFKDKMQWPIFHGLKESFVDLQMFFLHTCLFDVKNLKARTIDCFDVVIDSLVDTLLGKLKSVSVSKWSVNS